MSVKTPNTHPGISPGVVDSSKSNLTPNGSNLSGKPRPSVTQISRPFFTSSELSYLHSQTIADSKKLVFTQRKHQIFQFVFQIVKALKFPLRVLSTSMNYYQRFYLFNKFEDEEKDESTSDDNELEKDPYVVALTCVFLATKNEDCIKKLRDIQVVANKIRDIDETSKGHNGSGSNGASGGSRNSDSLAEAQRKAIMSLEFKLLQLIKFDFINGTVLTLDSIDSLTIQFCKKLGINYKISMFSWLIAFDIMSTPLCLMIPSHCISLAIIIVTLNLKPSQITTKFTPVEDLSEVNLEEILEGIDCYEQFRCPEPLVNEAIIYILDYYIHQMNYSILNEYIPAIDEETGKEQVFKFMELKSRFNDLTKMNQKSCLKRQLLESDEYLKVWDYSVAMKGSARFMLSNKRRRFSEEIDLEAV
ncbi:cyclin-like protein [Suhomyces tanzawaensis NRRL Y-17324]|uniref:Cyclin-like protein n=1 Tax=Suhomyces tanzawaensis NRRL Y-17324 TaxID=984487 RepID=A0A1E4SLJ0_9ASCO|nr:cyclin-like protein [Suhomyces tanzawaensis NRRL Y-17324]ODV80391.1 cyclin-like protein [Suhomyces tanzawaensis NRRL Y-17324]